MMRAALYHETRMACQTGRDGFAVIGLHVLVSTQWTNVVSIMILWRGWLLVQVQSYDGCCPIRYERVVKRHPLSGTNTARIGKILRRKQQCCLFRKLRSRKQGLEVNDTRHWLLRTLVQFAFHSAYCAAHADAFRLPAGSHTRLYSFWIWGWEDAVDIKLVNVVALISLYTARIIKALCGVHSRTVVAV